MPILMMYRARYGAPSHSKVWTRAEVIDRYHFEEGRGEFADVKMKDGASIYAWFEDHVDHKGSFIEGTADVSGDFESFDGRLPAVLSTSEDRGEIAVLSRAYFNRLTEGVS